jgi:hypothetical protein
VVVASGLRTSTLLMTCMLAHLNLGDADLKHVNLGSTSAQNLLDSVVWLPGRTDAKEIDIVTRGYLYLFDLYGR